MKNKVIKVVAPGLIGFLNSIIEVIADNEVIETFIKKHDSFLSLAYCAAVFVDDLLGDNEEKLLEKAVDELKEAIINIAHTHDVDAVGLW